MRYEYGDMFLNIEDNLWYTMTGSDKIEQITGIIIAHKYSLKAALNVFGEKWKHEVPS